MVRALALLALLVIIVVAVRTRGCHGSRPTAESAPADTTVTGMRAATLWFATRTGDGLVAESRELADRDALHERVAALVQALDVGPTQGGLATLPPGTAVLHVYLDERGLLTLDLSRAFRQSFRGGSRSEELAIGSLLRTITANVPDVKRVRLVCGGAPVTTLGGHFPLDEPLDPDDWP